jgi:Domain of unknown function (DUF4124)
MKVRCLLQSGLIMLALVLQPAAAQIVYKSTLPDGRVVYGDKPDPAAVKVETSTPDTSKRGIGGSTPREAGALREMENARTGREGADERVRAAQQSLQRAEDARAAGKEPLPGERIGTAGGGSRLNESYEARQRQLDAAVEKARRDLEEASAGK